MIAVGLHICLFNMTGKKNALKVYLFSALVSVTYGTKISHIKGNSPFFLMHSDIVNGHQLLCDAHTVLEQPRMKKY